jgi:hypothetical protein
VLDLLCIAKEKNVIPANHLFGASPILLSLSRKSGLILAQKSGAVYAIDPDDRGKLLWRAQVGQGGTLGGVEGAGDRFRAHLRGSKCLLFFALPAITEVQMFGDCVGLEIEIDVCPPDELSFLLPNSGAKVKMKKVPLVLVCLCEQTIESFLTVGPYFLLRVLRQIFSLEQRGQTEMVKENLEIVDAVPYRAWSTLQFLLEKTDVCENVLTGDPHQRFIRKCSFDRCESLMFPSPSFLRRLGTKGIQRDIIGRERLLGLVMFHLSKYSLIAS